MPRAGVRLFRRLQFMSLLVARSYRGLIPALNWWDVIDEHFSLGGALMFDDIERLQRQGIGAVMNLCAERQDDLDRLAEARMEYLWLPVIDICAPTFAQIFHGMQWIERQLHAGRAIYIHCAAGIGRSATMLACWYIYARGMSVYEALRFLKARHPQVALTRRQLRRLHEFADSLSSPMTRRASTQTYRAS
jgi:atypical dual specificity phosphatase